MFLVHLFRIRWPVLFIAKNDTFFHVASNSAASIRHALAEIQQWAGGDHSLFDRGRAADWSSAVEVFDSSRRRLRFVTRDGEVRVAPGFSPVPESDDVLRRRLDAVLEPLKGIPTAIPGRAADGPLLTVCSYATYLARVATVLDVAGHARVACRTQVPAGSERRVPVAVHTGTPPTAADLRPILGSTSELRISHTAGWFHNLMHQAWD